MAHILIVEDELVSQRLLLRLIEAMGHQVSVAASSVDAWAVLEGEEAAVEVIALDLGLPQTSGLDFLAEVRSHPIFKHCAVFVCSRHGERDFVLGAARQGVRYYIRKPVEPARLEEALRNLLEADPYGSLFEPVTTIAERRRENLRTVYERLERLNEGLPDMVGDLVKKLGTGDALACMDRLDLIESEGEATGFRGLSLRCRQEKREISKGNFDTVRGRVRTFANLRRLIPVRLERVAATYFEGTGPRELADASSAEGTTDEAEAADNDNGNGEAGDRSTKT